MDRIFFCHKLMKFAWMALHFSSYPKWIILYSTAKQKRKIHYFLLFFLPPPHCPWFKWMNHLIALWYNEYRISFIWTADIWNGLLNKHFLSGMPNYFIWKTDEILNTCTFASAVLSKNLFRYFQHAHKQHILPRFEKCSLGNFFSYSSVLRLQNKSFGGFNQQRNASNYNDQRQQIIMFSFNN